MRRKMKNNEYHFANWTTVFPFKQILDDQEQFVGVMAMSAPLYERAGKKEWKELDRILKSGIKLIGVSSYQEFPLPIVNAGEGRYKRNFFEGQPHVAKHMIGWLTCGRTEHRHIPAHLNPLLLSECDFTHGPTFPCARSTHKKWDFVYYCATGAWSEHCRNFVMARVLIPILLEHGMSIVIVGGKTPPRQTNKPAPQPHVGLPTHPNLTLLPIMKWCTFQRVLCQCRYLFMPNISDAAPRTMIECFWRNIPVIAHADIHGGWKHLHRSTSVTFRRVREFWPAVQRLVAGEKAGEFQPRRYIEAFQRHVQPRRLLYDYVQQQLRTSAAGNLTHAHFPSHMYRPALLPLFTPDSSSNNTSRRPPNSIDEWYAHLPAIEYVGGAPAQEEEEAPTTSFVPPTIASSRNLLQLLKEEVPPTQTEKCLADHPLPSPSTHGGVPSWVWWVVVSVVILVALCAAIWGLVVIRRRKKKKKERGNS